MIPKVSVSQGNRQNHSVILLCENLTLDSHWLKYHRGGHSRILMGKTRHKAPKLPTLGRQKRA